MLTDHLHHPLLTLDQELALARRIQAGDPDALDELVRHNLRLVYKIAQRYYTPDPGTEFDDLVQQGMVGLLEAARRYDPARNLRFTTFAFFWIRQGVQRLAVTAGTIPQRANRHYQEQSPASIRANAIRRAPIARLDAPLHDRRGDESNATLADIIADAAPSVEDQVLGSIEAERIFAELNLNARGQAIIRDWLSGLSRTEAQALHGVSRSWIHQILSTRKEKLMPRTSDSTTCIEPGCDQPRHVSARGVTLPRCHEHQKVVWREAAAARNNAPDAPPR